MDEKRRNGGGGELDIAIAIEEIVVEKLWRSPRPLQLKWWRFSMEGCRILL